MCRLYTAEWWCWDGDMWPWDMCIIWCLANNGRIQISWRLWLLWLPVNFHISASYLAKSTSGTQQAVLRTQLHEWCKKGVFGAGSNGRWLWSDRDARPHVDPHHVGHMHQLCTSSAPIVCAIDSHPFSRIILRTDHCHAQFTLLKLSTWIQISFTRLSVSKALLELRLLLVVEDGWRICATASHKLVRPHTIWRSDKLLQRPELWVWRLCTSSGAAVFLASPLRSATLDLAAMLWVDFVVVEGFLSNIVHLPLYPA